MNEDNAEVTDDRGMSKSYIIWLKLVTYKLIKCYRFQGEAMAIVKFGMNNSAFILAEHKN